MKIIRLLAITNLFCMFLLFGADAAHAHRVNIYAWLENDNVIVECDFGKDRPAKEAEISILDSVDKRTLLTGKTGPDGRFIFKVPSIIREGHGLIIDVNAGQGHHNEWTMEASELYAAASLTAGFDQAAIVADKQDAREGSAPDNLQIPQQSAPAQGSQAEPVQSVTAPARNAVGTPDAEQPAAGESAVSPGNVRMRVDPLTASQTRQIVHEVVQGHLAPIHRELAAQSSAGPTVTEIIGGLGWIIGLVGIFLYFKSRRAKQ